MCGISGVFGLNNSVEAFDQQLKNAAAKLNHRGPDHLGFYTSTNFIAAHNRLSIIDTSANANQPMLSEDGNYVLLFNGEIFNFIELKKDLQEKGVSFKTNSDTELLLKLLIREKENALNKLNGFFSFAFYSKKDNELLLARDRFGEKPLLYSIENNVLFFSSELIGLESFAIQKEIDQTALYYYFNLSYIPAPLSIYKSCKKLLPGHFIAINNQDITITKYYQPKQQQFEGSYTDAKLKLRELLFDAVNKRMISDVPLSSFLSGGIDSTIIAGIAKSFKSDLQTYSIGFPDYPFFDESEYAKIAAQHIKTQHELIPVSANDLDNAIDPVLNHLSEPFADSSAIPMYLLCNKVKTKSTVALSGDGADELFAGYNKHSAFLRAENSSLSNFVVSMLPGVMSDEYAGRSGSFQNKMRQVNKYRKGLKLNFKDRYLYWAGFTDKKTVADILLNKIDHTDLKKYDKDFTDLLINHNLNSVLLNDISLVLANDMLVKVDLMSMQNSLEVRPPFLDHRIVEFANSIPFDWKMNGSQNKKILRESFSEFIPQQILNRSKKGFEAPLKQWFSGALKNRIINEWLHPDLIQEQQLFNPEKIKSIVAAFKQTKMNENTIWSLIVFQQWWINRMK